jgi:hypothetical protein
MSMKAFEDYLNLLNIDARRLGVSIDRWHEYAKWEAAESQRMIEAVKAYALAHYERGGWDYVVETYGDSDIAKIIKGCRTASGAIKKMRAAIKPIADYREDIQSEAF